MAVSGVSGTSGSSTTSATSTDALISPDAFLKILMAQLKYQDPMDPMKTNEFLTELAQLTQVQLMQNSADSLKSLVAAQKNGSLSQWSNLIGKSISVDGSSVATGDSIVLNPSADYDSIVLSLKKADGTVTEQKVSNGDPLTLSYSGTDTVTVSAYALKGTTKADCSVGVYKTVTGIQSSDDGFVAVTSNGDKYNVSKITKIIG